MKKNIIFLFLLLPFLLGAAPSRVNTYTSGGTILASDVTGNEDALFNYLQAGVSVYEDGSIVNADINSSAAIQSDKLVLTSIAQDVGITSSGSLDNNGTTTLDGTVTTTSDITLGDGTDDTLTINTDDGITFTPAMTWTFTGNQTVSGTWADAGIMTTVDINGGTLDGVNIGTTTATGELFVNNSSDAADGLGSQGTSGQFLVSAGSGANPSWADGAVIFDQTGTLTAATTLTITETISAGDVYRLVIEGVINTAVADWVLRFNSDSTSGSYEHFMQGIKSTGGGAVTEYTYNSGTSGGIEVWGSDTPAVNSGIYLEFIITARNSDTLVRMDTSAILDSTESYVLSGAALMNTGTPTTINFLRSSGTSTITGRWYLHKFGTTP